MVRLAAIVLLVLPTTTWAASITIDLPELVGTYPFVVGRPDSIQAPFDVGQEFESVSSLRLTVVGAVNDSTSFALILRPFAGAPIAAGLRPSELFPEFGPFEIDYDIELNGTLFTNLFGLGEWHLDGMGSVSMSWHFGFSNCWPADCSHVALTIERATLTLVGNLVSEPHTVLLLALVLVSATKRRGHR